MKFVPIPGVCFRLHSLLAVGPEMRNNKQEISLFIFFRCVILIDCAAVELFVQNQGFFFSRNLTPLLIFCTDLLLWSMIGASNFIGGCKHGPNARLA